MDLSELSYQELSALYDKRQDDVLAVCREMQTTRPTPEHQLVLISRCDAASAALGEVKAELLKRHPARSGRSGW